MFCPSVYPWVEEPDEFTSPLQDGPNVATLLAVTKGTGIRQVIRFRRATVLHADDVVNLAPEERVVLVN